MKKKQGEMGGISKPKAVKKDNRIGSKTAPLETDFVLVSYFTIIL